MTDSSSSNELLFYVVEKGFSAAVWKKSLHSSYLFPKKIQVKIQKY